MPRSIALNPLQQQVARDALKRNGFMTQGDLAARVGISDTTTSKFFNSQAIRTSIFENICEERDVLSR
ncbi:MAG: winged helix-turn-helix transcriptional regulator [Cyanobacteria bacterium P01_E01_bin.42]